MAISSSIISRQQNMPEIVGSANVSKKSKTEAPSTDPPTKSPPSTEPSVALSVKSPPKLSPVESSAKITPTVDGCPEKPRAFVECAKGTDDKKEQLGNIPLELFTKAGNLSYAMKEEVMDIAALSRCPRQDPVLYDSSDDEEFDIGSTSRTNIVTSPGTSPRIGSRNEVYAFQYACPNIVTAHMDKNGQFTDEKTYVYNKEFITHLFESMQIRNDKGSESFHDDGLLCNKLDIHIHVKKIDKGTLLKDPKKVAQFFNVWNQTAARDLLS